jgi:hypothetical protein
MVDWYDPTVLQEYAQTAAVLDTALRLLDRLLKSTSSSPLVSVRPASGEHQVNLGSTSS